MKKEFCLLLLIGLLLFSSSASAEYTMTIDGHRTDWDAAIAAGEAQCSLHSESGGVPWVDIVEVCVADDASTNGYFYMLIRFREGGNNNQWIQNGNLILNVDYNNDGEVDHVIDFVNDPAEEVYGIINLPLLEVRIPYDLVDPEGTGQFSWNLTSLWRDSHEDQFPPDGEFAPYVKDPDTLSPRAVRMLSMGASARDQDGVTVKWTTASERNNAGFHVYRRSENNSIVPLTRTPIPGLGNSPFGRTYRFVDRQGLGGDVYFIEDVEYSGKTRTHGPITAAEEDDMARFMMPELVSRQNRPFSFRDWLDRIFRNTQPARRPSANSNTLRLRVDTPGLHSVPTELLTAEGLSVSKHRSLRLNRDGRSVPQFRHNGTARFIAFPQVDRYADYSVYTVTPGPGRPMQTGHVSRCRTPETAIRQTLTIEENRHYYVATPTDDPFFWEFAYIGWPAHLTFDVPQATSKEASITVSMAGFATGVDGPDHVAEMYLNDTFIGSHAWDGTDMEDVTFSLPAGLLSETDNHLEIHLMDDGIMDMLALDRITVDYQRRLMADAQDLVFSALGQDCVQIQTTDDNSMVFDISDPSNPLRIRGAERIHTRTDQGIRFRVPGRTDRRYLITSIDRDRIPEPDGLTQPLRVRDYTPARYLVISHPMFIDSAEQLAAYHDQRGMTARVVTTSALYDHFSGGRPNPKAIRDFIEELTASRTTRLSHVLLLGGSTVDSNDVLGLGDDDFIPTPFYRTDLMGYEAANDGWYVQNTNVAIGRLPVSSRDEAEDVTFKLVTAYEQMTPAGTSLYLADHDRSGGSDPTGIFEHAATTQIQASGPFAQEARTLFLNDGVTSQMLSDAILRGVDFLNFHGHAFLSGWSGSPQIANLAFADSLTNRNLFVLMSWSCFDGAFVGPWDHSLAWRFVQNPNAGAMAAIAGSSLSDPLSVEKLSQQVTAALASGIPTIGEAFSTAELTLLQTSNTPGHRDTVHTFNLIGDPAAPNPWAF